MSDTWNAVDCSEKKRKGLFTCQLRTGETVITNLRKCVIHFMRTYLMILITESPDSRYTRTKYLGPFCAPRNPQILYLATYQSLLLEYILQIHATKVTGLVLQIWKLWEPIYHYNVFKPRGCLVCSHIYKCVYNYRKYKSSCMLTRQNSPLSRNFIKTIMHENRLPI